MAEAATATVVVVARDLWAQAPGTLETLLARTDPRHPVVVVDAKAPRSVSAAFDRAEDSGRVRVVRNDHQLAGNQARNLGAHGAATEWIAFVENDVVVTDGWLDELLAAGEARNATSVFPVYLMPGPDGPKVHGLGSDLEIGGPEGAGYVRERRSPYHGWNWHDVPRLEPVERIQGEPHLFVVRREFLERIGGVDEELLGWFDHTEVALHHHRLGASCWFIPTVTCLYQSPPPVAYTDLPGFLLRWSEEWFERSLHRLCSVWGIDPHDREWAGHARYREKVRSSVPTRWHRLNKAATRAVAPVERVVTRRLDARR